MQNRLMSKRHTAHVVTMNHRNNMFDSKLRKKRLEPGNYNSDQSKTSIFNFST